MSSTAHTYASWEATGAEAPSPILLLNEPRTKPLVRSDTPAEEQARLLEDQPFSKSYIAVLLGKVRPVVSTLHLSASRPFDLKPSSAPVSVVTAFRHQQQRPHSSHTQDSSSSRMPSVAELRQPPMSTLPPAKRVKMDASKVHMPAPSRQNAHAAIVTSKPQEIESVAADSTSYMVDDTSETSSDAKLAALKQAQEVDDVEPVPASTSPLRYENSIVLAPMVRIGTLPTRLLSLEYGADLVWGPEIVDRAIIGCERRVNPVTGVVEFLKDNKQIFSCHPVERPYLVYQIGTANPDLAAQAVKVITQADDVAAVDLNCGCPKPFSTHAGMGANLLSTPTLLCNILKSIRRAAPAHVAVTCKIRLLPTQAATVQLVDKIVRTNAIECLTVHCRTKDMRPREPALHQRLREIVEQVERISAELGRKIPVICNGDCWDAQTAPRIKELTGVTSTMIARGAEANPSCFRPQGNLSIPETIAPKWVKYSIALNNPIGNTKYCMAQLAFKPAESVAKEAQQNSSGDKKLMSKKQLSALRSGIAQAKTHEDLAQVFNIDVERVRAENIESEILKDLKEALSHRVKQTSGGFDGQRVGAVIDNANQSSGSNGGGSGGQQQAGDGHAQGSGQSRATGNSPQPEWKQLIADNVGKYIKDEKSILYYAFSTVEAATSVHDAAKPHVRYVVHRGFVNEKRDGEAEGGIGAQNPKFGSSPCLMTTTDVRTPKVQQLTSQSSLRAQGTDGSHGGECEIAWWIESAQLQFRISGTVHVLPRQGHPLRSLFPFERLSPPRAPDSDSTEPFDWDGERTRIFNKLNAGLLASFCRPTPGTPHPNADRLHQAKPKDDINSPWPLELPQPGKEENEEQKRQLEESEKNFALVVVEPYKVDLVNLADDSRTIYELEPGHSAATGHWTARRVVP
ncbi:FMN-linked oxidoreductase [Testicularia cyperi]|uniref:FMN-linked oxidoreductase n=1 Tax=Testicularia cyperi TaxID=1882483 RepID=A0A317XMA4_9BASI|nr:FMN-linked oxidoreductase [Testicularia cyperi]